MNQRAKRAASSRGLPRYDEWRLPDPVDPALAESLAGRLPVHSSVLPVVVKRCAGDPEKARHLLFPAEIEMPDPRVLPGVEAAVRRLIQAITRDERIVVYSDYDADGVTGAAIMKEALDFAGAKRVAVYFPSRFQEGYGFHASSVEQIVSEGPCLFVTTDCGITGVEGCRQAALLGSHVIVTDHHLPGQRLPDALSIIDPHLPEWAGLGLWDLTGAGVAYLLACALFIKAGVEKAVPHDWAHDLLTLSIAGDGYPVVGINRYWVTSGLSSLVRTRRPGIAALLQVAGIWGEGAQKRTISFERDVTFGLVPRLNAAGRLEDARSAFRVLVEKDPEEAMCLAIHLDKLNRERRAMEEAILGSCASELERDEGNSFAVCLSGSDWHEGVIGIVASKLKEDVGLPVVLAAGTGDVLRGSVRGIPGFNVVEALTKCGEFLVAFGGHEGAGGFSVRREALGEFFSRFKEVSAELLSSSVLSVPLDVDGVLDVREASEETLKALMALEPFGQGNEIPIMACLDCSIEDIAVMGKSGDHLKLRLSKDGASREFIWFGMGSLARTVALMGRVDVAFVPYRNVYLGEERFSALVRDMRPSWAESGKGYDELVRDVEAAASSGRSSIVYTWSHHAARSIWTAFRKAGLKAALHLEGYSPVESHEANLALSTPGGVAVSTAPWELQMSAWAGGIEVFVAHEPFAVGSAKKLRDFCASCGASWAGRPELAESSMSWLSWTYPEKESVQLVWKSLKECSSNDSVPYVCLDDVRREVMDGLGYGSRLPGAFEGGRLLIEKVLSILEEMGSVEHDCSRRVPSLRLRAGGKFHLASSPTYVEGKRVWQGTLKALTQ